MLFRSSSSSPPHPDLIQYGTIGEQLYRFSADSFLVYHKDKLIYEKYVKAGDEASPDPGSINGANKTRMYDAGPENLHDLRSQTKSYVGMIFQKLLHETSVGFREDDPVVKWVPELKDTAAFNTTTVRMIADMSYYLDWDETSKVNFTDEAPDDPPPQPVCYIPTLMKTIVDWEEIGRAHV